MRTTNPAQYTAVSHAITLLSLGVLKVIKENIGIVHGCITTMHCITNTQVRQPAPCSAGAGR
jgi:glyceraldehyde-3-phosphate dehydrogenase/erythrose-4-phosphate dehydrogenase